MGSAPSVVNYPSEILLLFTPDPSTRSLSLIMALTPWLFYRHTVSRTHPSTLAFMLINQKLGVAIWGEGRSNQEVGSSNQKPPNKRQSDTGRSNQETRRALKNKQQQSGWRTRAHARSKSELMRKERAREGRQRRKGGRRVEDNCDVSLSSPVLIFPSFF